MGELAVDLELLRVAIGAAIVQSGYMDQDPETGTIDLLQWHPCSGAGEPNCQGDKCRGCSGVPYLSDAVAEQLDKFGYLTRALSGLASKVEDDNVESR